MRPYLKHLLATIGIGLSALFLWLALREVDASALWAALLQTNLLWLGPFVLCVASFCWLKAVRWAMLLAPERRMAARDLVAPVVIGYMGTALMPMQLGELARAYLVANSSRMRLAGVLASILIERILDVMVLLIIIAAIGVLGAELSSEYRAFGFAALSVVLPMLAALWLFAAYTDGFMRLIGAVATMLPRGLRNWILDQLRSAASGLKIMMRPGRYLALIAISLAQWSFMCICTWISVAAVGHYVAPAAALTVLATTIVSMTLPSAPGYVGALQLAYVLALSAFAIGKPDALAASFFYLVALWVPLVLAGFFCLHRMGLRLRSVAVVRNTETPS